MPRNILYACLFRRGVKVAVRHAFLIILVGSAATAAFPLLSRALTVGPAKIEYATEPGRTISDELLLVNDEDAPRTFYPAFEKFTEANGEKQFLPGEPTELVHWFKVPARITLKPGEQKQVPFTIEVPANAPPGGHFAVIWWSTAPPGAKGVSIVTRAGILVYLQVSGDVRESGTLTTFSTIRQKRVFSGFPDTFILTFQNTGNTYLKPKGEIRIKNIFGSTRVTYGVNDVNLILLPQTTNELRITKQATAVPFAFGMYNAELMLRYGEKPETIQKSILIFIIPWKVVLVVLIVLALLLWIMKRGIKKYNQWIIAKHAGKS